MKAHFSPIIPTVLAAAVLLALSGSAVAQQTRNADQPRDDSAQEASAAGASAGQSAQRSDRPTGQQRENTSESAQTMSTVVVTGTHVAGRTVKDSMQPIDVISPELLDRTGFQNLTKALDRQVPSMNFNNSSNSDLEAFQRAYELRGLTAGATLVLVNGKRWHPGAIIGALGNHGQGDQFVDLNTIPMSAIDHIEVLRNGASAIYGSDAIAGVINIILKKGAEGGDIAAKYGKYSAGDGKQYNLSARFGVPLGEDGWMRFAVRKANNDGTNRAEPDIRPGAPAGVKQHYGLDPYHDGNFFLNSEYDVTPDTTLYAFGEFARHVATPPGFFRYGTNTPFPKSPLLKNIYPDGFLPQEKGVGTDRALTVGLRGKAGGWRWDTSAGYGGNRVSYYTNNSMNLALYNDFGSTQSDFHDGILRAAQQFFDIDIQKDFAVGWLHSPLSLAFGTQWLRNSYSLSSGDLGSYYVGTSGVQGGAQGFSGWGPEDAVSAARHSLAEYVQLEGKLSKKFELSLSARHSNYSDFGSNTSYALSGRYAFTPTFALRGTVSTGFKAPTIGQESYSQTSSHFLAEGNPEGLPVGIYLEGLVPANNPLARLMGAEELRPETSHNYTVGAVWTPTDAYSLSVDLYQVTVDDNITLSSTVSLIGDTVQDYLADHGFEHSDFVGVKYLSNAGTLRTQGADIVSTWRTDLGNWGSLNTVASYSYHKNKVTHVEPNPAVLDELGVQYKRLNRSTIKGLLADNAPRSKFILDETLDLSNWEFGANLTRYGTVTSYNSTDPTLDQVFSAEWTLGVTASYFRGPWTFTLGSENVANNYPDRALNGTNHGTFPYSELSPFGFSGAYYYARARYRW